MNRQTLIVARTIGVIGGITAIVTGLTFAQLSQAATLGNTTINSTDASLNIWNGAAYAPTAPGFTITGLVPGTGVNENMYLQNTGGLNEVVTANVPTLPSSSGFTGWNNALVEITAENITTCTNVSVYVPNTATALPGPGVPTGTGNTLVTDLQDLNSGNVILPCILNAGDTGNTGVSGTPGNYDLHFDIVESSVTGSSASIGGFPIDLTGTQTP